MIKRRKTRNFHIGPLKIGSEAPVIIQSMTKVDTQNITAVLKQIKDLTQAGCELVRIAVPTLKDSKALRKIIEQTETPLIADIHFSPSRAIEAIEAGAAKIRLNPGNIKNKKDILRIIDAAKAHNTAVRIGVNEASIRDLKRQTVPPAKRIKLMLNEMKKYVRIFENRSFAQLVLSAKSSDCLRNIKINRLIAEHFDYPLHLGLTHAGLPEDAQIPSAISIGSLLADGIGDTIRVSVAGNPVMEIEIAKQILTSLGLYHSAKPELIVCPTCGRAQIDVIKLAKKVKKALSKIEKPLRIAVMGCVVNGPGEAEDADIALCAAKNKAYLYKNGRRIATIAEKNIIPELLKHLENI